MSKKSLTVLVGILLIAYFFAFALPNALGAHDSNMLTIFEQDEYAQYNTLVRILSAPGNWKGKLFSFIRYEHYYYGLPFYIYSALFALPFKLTSGGLTQHTSTIVLLLRQFGSVTPMMSASLIMLWTQTKLKPTFKTLLVLIALLLIPAVIRNNLWWHPDSLAILFVSLVFLFLVRDDLNFGNNFYLAAFFTGLATGTKLIGLYFFLTIGIYLIMGIYQKKISITAAFFKGFLFTVILVVTTVASNPYLLWAEGRVKYWLIQQAQMDAMQFGWHVAYDKGPASWLPIINQFYGPLFWLSILGSIVGLFNPKSRRLQILILCWVTPYFLHLLFFIAAKPPHYLLPIAIPLFTGLIHLLKLPPQITSNWRKGLKIGAVIIILFGLLLDFQNATDQYSTAINKEKDNPPIQFYAEIKSLLNETITPHQTLTAYREVYFYLPNNSPIQSNILWGLPTYEYINENQFDFLMVTHQQSYDYTQPETVSTATNPATMQAVYDFYSDVRAQSVEGYTVIYENDFGLLLEKTTP